MELNAKKIDANETAPSALPLLLDDNGVEWNAIGCNNWAADYPYAPGVHFRIAYTDKALLLHYRVTEDSVRAKYAADNEAVWTDSCVEFFVAPGLDDGIYYNLECNCIGTVLLGGGGGEYARTRASAAVLDSIKRWTSLGSNPFEERREKTSWEAALVVPFTALWLHHFVPAANEVLRANFFKCGDELSKPHFLSWAPIEADKPNFHLPEFFGKVTLV